MVGTLATDDVFPTGGTLHFLSGDVSDTFIISVLPDEVPEEREVSKKFLLSTLILNLIMHVSFVTCDIRMD